MACGTIENSSSLLNRFSTENYGNNLLKNRYWKNVCEIVFSSFSQFTQKAFYLLFQFFALTKCDFTIEFFVSVETKHKYHTNAFFILLFCLIEINLSIWQTKDFYCIKSNNHLSKEKKIFFLSDNDLALGLTKIVWENLTWDKRIFL